jgi:hypothetical protein
MGTIVASTAMQVPRYARRASRSLQLKGYLLLMIDGWWRSALFNIGPEWKVPKSVRLLCV